MKKVKAAIAILLTFVPIIAGLFATALFFYGFYLVLSPPPDVTGFVFLWLSFKINDALRDALHKKK